MNDSDLFITLAQINVRIGDFEQNFIKIKSAVEQAVMQKSDVIVFPELVITGYPPLDMLEQNEFSQQISETLKNIALLSENIGIIVGAPTKNESGKGKQFLNSACFFYKKKCIAIASKGLIPNYDIFDEYRYFEPADEFQVCNFLGHTIALTVCEDLWDKSDSLEYKVHPMEILMNQKPEIIINIAASPFDYLKYETRKNILKRKAIETKLPLFYVNHVGANTELIFDGGSMAISPEGKVVGQMRFFEEDIQTFSLHDICFPEIIREDNTTLVSRIHKALVLGIKDYFVKSGFSSAVIGLSGGVDSALVAALATQALGNEHVHAIFLPTSFSSDESLTDAKLLAEKLNISFDIISIENVFQNMKELLQPAFTNRGEDITEENIQSRLRGLILMAHSNIFGYILLNTSNKSEIATGYGTLYGDMCGSISVIGDLYKTQVYELCHYINNKQEIIPKNILVKEPTAELKPGQKDTDSLPPYPILDTILFQYLEQNARKSVIASLPEVGEELADKIIRMVNRNEFKRFQAPPILRISPKAFGMGRRFPLVAKFR